MKQGDLSILIKRAHRDAVKLGWHNGEHSEYYYLMFIISEISELVKSYKHGHHADLESYRFTWDSVRHNNENFASNYEACIKGTVEDELACICIRIFDMIGTFKFSVSDWDIVEHNLKTPEQIQETVEQINFAVICFTIVKQLCYNNIDEVNNNLIIALVSIIALAKAMKIDLDWYIGERMKYNEKL